MMMTSSQVSKLVLDPQKPIRGRFRQDEPLARFTTWRVGGPAAWYFAPSDLDDLATFLGSINCPPCVVWLGLGSNVLIRDDGIPGLVIHTANTLDACEQTSSGEIRVECGLPCAKLARFAARSDLAGAEFFAGIPGTLGGALAMNAGAWGGETWECVESVKLIDRQGKVEQFGRDAFEVGYRHVRGPRAGWFVEATLRFEPGDGRAAAQKSKELLRQRALSQPTGQRSCGSVFRNPPDDYAARLIEQAGLKGLRIGGAHVSLKHANFIINDEQASATDIENLIEEVKRTVKQRFDIELQPEVRVLGLSPDRASGAIDAGGRSDG